MAEEDNAPAFITKPGVLAFGDGLPAAARSNITTFFDNKTVVQMSCGRVHSAVVCESGQVYTFGINENAEPRLVDFNSRVRITQTACGTLYTMFLTNNGEVYSCGGNHHGQQGLGHTDEVPTPVLVPGLPPVRKVAAGCYHTVVLTHSGQVWVSGHNQKGQLGVGNTYTLTSFTQVCNLPEPIDDVSCGGYHTAVITVSRVLFMSGLNEHNQLGWRIAKNQSIFRQAASKIAEVSCGYWHTVALDLDGTSLAWGRNESGQLGTCKECDRQPSPEKVVGICGVNVSQVIAGWSQTAILTKEGDVWVLGRERNGDFGPGKKKILTATMLTKSPGLVVKQMAFSWKYSLLLVESSTKTPAPQLQIGATKEGDATITDLERSFVKALECPVCMTIMCAPIHQCAKGHSLCAACRSGPACPLCRDRLTEARNYALESLSSDVRLPCSECHLRMPASEIARHSQFCPGRSYGCPVDTRCGWLGLPPAMLAHATQAHAGSTWARLPHMFVQTATADVLLAAHGQVFTLHRRYEAGERFRAAVSYIGPPENAYNYQLEFAVMTDSLKNTFHRNICTDIENIDAIFQSSNCVTIESDVVKTFIQRGRLLCRVAILEAGTSDLADQVRAFRSLHDEAATTAD